MEDTWDTWADLRVSGCVALELAMKTKEGMSRADQVYGKGGQESGGIKT